MPAHADVSKPSINLFQVYCAYSKPLDLFIDPLTQLPFQYCNTCHVLCTIWFARCIFYCLHLEQCDTPMH